MNVVDWTVKEAVTPVKNREPCVEQTKRLSDLPVRWSWWALAMVPFRFVVFQCPHDQIECPSLSMSSRSSCEDQPCVTGDRFVAGFAPSDCRRRVLRSRRSTLTRNGVQFAGNSRRRHCSHKCRHREICRQGRKCHRGHLFSYKLDRIGRLGVDRSECRERKRWRRTSAKLRLNFRTLWILSSARCRLFVMR